MKKDDGMNTRLLAIYLEGAQPKMNATKKRDIITALSFHFMAFAIGGFLALLVKMLIHLR